MFKIVTKLSNTAHYHLMLFMFPFLSKEFLALSCNIVHGLLHLVKIEDSIFFRKLGDLRIYFYSSTARKQSEQAPRH